MKPTYLNLMGAAAIAAASFVAGPAAAQQLDVTVMERTQGDLDTCAQGEVRGLKADGDGFLAVRSGPSTKYRKIDELINGNKVWLFDQKGPWVGIVYGVPDVDCSPIAKDRPVPYPAMKGWVHENWIGVTAG
ncbi:MAG: SH3 domain-containing protein [Pseudomonadota bacterium]